ncbi:TIGR02594 family protein [Loktanella sp. TSTF-M6]|uniref:TIGR02594 family protein n=1 Tax=Loktanella gaetbuli TaxID=2881335 RepID=A0ABS8BTE8_9RHOB|nr:TIGR02594 family protein [Loktanella gaetbuli]MCB5199010.1 TIGR02594 family protein [Loktanella gaetbuli]
MKMQNELMRAVQGRLKVLGYYRLNVDGVDGPGTSNAVIDFKANNGLLARDYIGSLTLERMFSPSAKPVPKPKPATGEPAWLTEAKRLLGTREVAGSGNSPIIMDWAEGLDQWYPGDDVPWCGLFVAHCMATGAPDEPQDFNRLGARAWREFGVKVPISFGAIAVFWRTHPTRSWNGHVGFVVGGDKDTLHILGGNQSDSVNVTRIARSRLLECRGPEDWRGDENLKAVSTASLSTNEA